MIRSEDDIRAMSARQKIRAADAQCLPHDERRTLQKNRAICIAQNLAGRDASRNLINSVLALVEADERPDPPETKNPGPAPGARRVLKTKTAKKGACSAPQEVLW